MVAFFDIFAYLSVLLRGITLAAEALTVGGVIFQLAIAPRKSLGPLSGLLMWSAGILAAAQACYVAANATVLMASTNLTWAQVATADFCIAGALMIAGAGLTAWFARTHLAKILCPAGCALILAGAVMTSHSVGRLEYRWILAALTLTHHLAAAAWIGGLPYLLWSLKHSPDAAAISSRFSRMAILAVGVLVSAGVVMSLIYVGSTGALTGTTYGIMVLAKAFLTALMVMLGALNRNVVQVGIHAVRAGAAKALLQLRRFTEVEVGIGLTIIMAAASLTSSPPAVDVRADRVSAAEIVLRLTPRWPRMRGPSPNEFSAVTPNAVSNSVLPASFVPGQSTTLDSLAEIAWSEYHHHVAGFMVLAMGILSLLARRMSWARYWPLSFLGLAVFLITQADEKNWPIGPRGFWESLAVPEVPQHAFFVVLIIAFAVFECGAQTSRIRWEGAGLVFPMVCAVSGTLLLAHSHPLSNVKQEFLVELNHLPIALLSVVAGWARWIEVRLAPEPEGVVLRRFAAWIWPACFIVIGAILINYREA